MAELRPTFRGYLYQDLATAAQFARTLLGQVDHVRPEQKLHADDIFDDLTQHEKLRLLRRQFKHSDKADRTLEPEDLRTLQSNLRIDNVCDSINAAGQTQVSEFRICATWGLPSDATLKDLLIRDSAEGTFPGCTTSVFRVDLERLWPQSTGFIWSLIASNTRTRDDYRAMCDRLRIELGCPRMSADLQAPGPAEQVLLRLLSDEIGVGRFPNEHLQPADVAGRLIYEAQAARAAGKELTRSGVESLLRLRTDYGRVAQKFPVRWEEVIHFSNVRQRLGELAKSKPRTLVVGPPGSGKSWALTGLAGDLKRDGIAVGRHYCYVSISDADAPKRILIDTFYGNLTDSLIQAVPDFAELNRPFYASGPAEFQSLLNRIFDKYREERIVLIVDGLDHIARIRAQSGQISVAGSDIIGELAHLHLPANVGLVLGSQPGEHLQGIRHLCEEFPFPVWNEEETREFLSQVGVIKLLGANEINVDIDSLSQAVHQKSEGNPLYTWYLVQEMRGAIARQEARTPIEIVGTAPAYDEHLTQYYSHLIGIGQPAIETLASILACIDFGLTREHLREIGGPWAAQLLDAILESLRPVLDETSSQGGIRIYHDSFRRFMLERLGGAARVSVVLGPVISWLQQRGFLQDAFAFRFLIPSLSRASRDGDVLGLIGPTFVSDALANGHSQAAIFANLREAAWAAVRTNDLPYLAAIAELHKAAWTAFEDNLQFRMEEYGSAFAAVRGGTALAERLLFDGRPTLERGEGLLLCRIADVNGASAPWAEYRALEEVRHEGEGWETGAVAEFTGALRLRGFQALEPALRQFLAEEQEHSPKYLDGILEEIARIEGFGALSQLGDVAFANDANAAAVFLECARHCPAVKQGERCLEYLKKAAGRTSNSVVLVRCIDLGLDRATVSQLVASNSNFNLPQPPTARHPEDDAEHVEWIARIQIHAFIQNPDLQQLRAGISAPGWYPAWLRFVIDLFGACALLSTDSNGAARAIVSALRELATFKNPFEGSPRACDLYRLHGVIAGTFRSALESITTTEDWQQALHELEEISERTSTHIQGERGFTGPLSSDALASLLGAFSNRASVARVALDRLAALATAVEEKGEYYSAVASHYFGLAEAQARLGERESAANSWRKASRALCGYGWRKDTTVWELFESVPRLAAFDRNRAEAILSHNQSFADSVLLHTDGRETKNAPNAWFEALVKTNPVHAAIVLGRSMSDDGGSWQWHWETAIEDLLEGIQGKADPRVVFLLDFIRPWEPPKHWKTYDRIASIESMSPFVPLINSAIQWCAAKLQDDPAKSDLTSLERLTEIGERFNEKVVIPDEEPTEERNPLYSDEPNQDVAFRGPRFAEQASPLQILVGLSRSRGEVGRRTRAVDLVNALGYRLLELLQSGDLENVVRILTAFGQEWHYEGAGEALIEFAEGFERHGYRRAAAEAFALAFRGLNDNEAAAAFSRAAALDKSRAVQVIAETNARLLDESWGVYGVPKRLTNAAIALGESELAFNIRERAAVVIEERLWGTGNGVLIFSQFDRATLPPATIDEAMGYVIVARTSHPENLRRLSSFSAISILIKQNFTPIAWGVDQYLRCNALSTSILAILELIRDFEQPPYDISKRLFDIFEYLASSDQFSIAVLSRQLIERQGGSTQAKPAIIVPQVFVPLSARRTAIALSLDKQKRVESMERVWKGCGSMIAAEMDRLMRSNKSNRERMHKRWRASRDDLYPERPVTQGLRWEGELFEMVLQRFLSRMPEELLKSGLWDVDSEQHLLDLVSPGAALHVARMLSRIPRPAIDLPSDISDSHGPSMVPVNTNQHGDWVLLARYEKQISLRRLGERAGGQEIVTYTGIVSVDSSDELLSSGIPFGVGNWQTMWAHANSANARKPLRWTGPLAGFDLSDSVLGNYSFLGLSESMRRLLDLHRSDAAALILRDGEATSRILMRSWWTLGVTDHSERGDNELVGCELLGESSVLKALVASASNELMVVTHVLREPLHGDDN
jgi:hypothetical protein